MIDFGKGKHSEVMSIWQFLEWEKPSWAMSPRFTSIVFREVGQFDSYRYVFIGKSCPWTFSLQREVMPDTYKHVPDIGGLMGELMNMSVQFNLYKVSVGAGMYECQYTVWMSKVEPGQECNIDADMVEKFSNKVFGK